MPLATPDDAIREFALNATRDLPEEQQPAWLITDYDTWVRNPRYTGPAVKCPEWDEE